VRRRAWSFAGLLAIAPVVQAHGFGQRYDLPLPLALYLSGAALTIVLSCLMLALFVRAAPRDPDGPRRDLLALSWTRALASPGVVASLRLAAVAVYALVVFAGLFGNQNTFRNIAPVAVWALWWVGFGYLSALVGDLWKVVNPLETLFAFAERWYSRLSRGKALSLSLPVPEALGAWPAVFLYLVFLWLEIAWDGSDSPSGVATLVLLYSLATWIGMWVYGREAWLARGEAFACVFGVLGRFAPLRIGLAARRVVEFELRPYAIGLLAREPVDRSRIALVILILASVSFDGFVETPAWAAIMESFAGDAEPKQWPRAAGLVAAASSFLALYAIFCRLIVLSARSAGGAVATPPGTRRVAGLFVLTLVPIAIAYQLAHYLSFLVQAGQYVVPLASDPFGWGWDLFGTVNHFVRIGIIDARLVWIVSVGAIVAGHVAALYLGHILSLREFPDRRSASRSQMPMLALMVAYTMLSLWIIAQPIVNTR